MVSSPWLNWILLSISTPWFIPSMGASRSTWVFLPRLPVSDSPLTSVFAGSRHSGRTPNQATPWPTLLKLSCGLATNVSFRYVFFFYKLKISTLDTQMGQSTLSLGSRSTLIRGVGEDELARILGVVDEEEIPGEFRENPKREQRGTGSGNCLYANCPMKILDK